MAISATIAGLGGIALAAGNQTLGEGMLISGLVSLGFAWLGDPRPNDAAYQRRIRDARRITAIRQREQVGADPDDFITAERAPGLALRHRS